MPDKLERARQLGVLKDGWRFIDYCLDAAPAQKWICGILWGEKGSLKSNKLLQDGYAVFHGFDELEKVGVNEDGANIIRGVISNWEEDKAWESTLRHIIFRPKDFAVMLRKVLSEKIRLSWVGWDDINIHFPRSMYSTNRTVWENFSKNWEGFRANLSIFECTVPRKDKVVSFILSDMNWDILISGRHMAESTRWYWDKDYYEPEKVNKFRIDVDSEEVVQNRVPDWVWKIYWDRKMALIDESTEGFQKMLEDIDKIPDSASKKEFFCFICNKDMGNNFNLTRHNQKMHKSSILSHPTVSN